jgi:two-component system, cell cycle response regulator CtrA
MRVLIIEDDISTAQSIELMLKSASFNVYTTDLGEEGIDLGKIYDYDIILLDLNLPDMSGFEGEDADSHSFGPCRHRGQG